MPRRFRHSLSDYVDRGSLRLTPTSLVSAKDADRLRIVTRERPAPVPPRVDHKRDR